MARYCIVGGVAGGASVAARLRRLDEKAEIVLFERGPYISYANCGLPYYIGGVIRERDNLFVMKPSKFKAWAAIDIRTNTEVLSIDRQNKKVHVRATRGDAKNTQNAQNSENAENAEYDLSYDYLVLSPGAEPLVPNIPGIHSEGIFTLRSVPEADRIVEFIEQKKPKEAIVVGGGFIGLEMAENLHARGLTVTIVEALGQVMNTLDFEMAAMLHQELKANGVALRLGVAVQRFERKGERLDVLLADGSRLEADMVLLSIGIRPDGKLAQGAGLATAPNGAILVDKHLRTSDPSIYALGDAIAFPHPILGTATPIALAGPTNKQARVVADSIVRSDVARTWRGALGTSIAKVFGLTAGSTGASEKQLKANGMAYHAVVTYGSSHASYYPGSQSLTIKTLFAPDTGRLLGAQIVGGAGVEARLALLSETIRRLGCVTDLADIEHAYAPPYSSARDPVNIAGMAAENVLTGLTQVVQWHEIEAERKAGAFLLDVRTPAEFALGTIPGAVNLPLEELRGRLSELPREGRIVIFCAAGLRGYLAERILRQNGWEDVANLTGGYRIWKTAAQAL